MTGRKEIAPPGPEHEGPHYLITDDSGLIVPCTLHARWCVLCPRPDVHPGHVERPEGTVVTRLTGRRRRTA